jgi:hypothetical protein
MTLNFQQIYNQVQTINKENDLIYLKVLTKTTYNKLIKNVYNILQITQTIVKGSRSLYNTLSKQLFTEEEYNYKDFDLYCVDADLFYNLLLDELIKLNLKHIVKKEINPVFNDMLMISLYNQKYIDLQIIDEIKFDIIPKIRINDINYIDPHFMKIDMYNVFATPTLFNVSGASEKFLKRIDFIEKEYKYKNINNIKLYNNTKLINSIKLVSKHIITGFLAYKLLFNINIDIPFLEIFSTNPQVEINNIKKQININKIDKAYGIDYSTENLFILYQNDIPIVYIYRLTDCKSFIHKKNKLISTVNLLLYYFNICIYLNKYYYKLENKKIYNIKNIVYTTILSKLYKKFNHKMISNCIGDMQPIIIRNQQNKINNKKIKTTITI